MAAATAGAAIAAAFAGFTVAAAMAADAVGDAADRMGVAVESLSRLKFAATQSDVAFEALTTGVKHWQVVLSSAASGQKEAADALGLIGLKAADLKSLALEDQLAKIADQFKRIQDPADKTRVAVELFSRAGDQLVPLLSKGGQALRDFAKDADAAGITLDEVTAKRIDVSLKRWEKLKDVMEALGARTAGAIAGAFGVFGDQIDAQSTKLEGLIKLRDDLSKGFSDAAQDPYRAKQIEDLNKAIESARIALSRLKGDLGQSGHGPVKGLLPLEIPKDDSQMKRLMDQLDMIRVSESLLADPLIQWEKDTRTYSEKVADDFIEFQAKLDELIDQGRISVAEANKRSNEKLDDVLQTVQISVSRMTPIMTEAQERAKAFTDTLKEGLENAARSGETTGKGILRNLLAAFESKELFKAIERLGDALETAFTRTQGSFGSTFLNSLLGTTIFGHAAGGGSTYGATIVGEDGPELLLGGGQVMNRRQLAFASGSSTQSISYAPNTTINVQGNADSNVLQAMEIRIQQNNKKQLENLSRILQTNGYKALR